MPAESTLTELYEEDLYTTPKITAIGLARPWESYGDAERELLARIVQSVRLTMDGVRVTHGWVPAKDIGRIVLFGVEPVGNSSTYQLTTIDVIQALFADDLQNLDDLKKKALWQKMREMFGV